MIMISLKVSCNMIVSYYQKIVFFLIFIKEFDLTYLI